MEEHLEESLSKEDKAGTIKKTALKEKEREEEKHPLARKLDELRNDFELRQGKIALLIETAYPMIDISKEKVPLDSLEQRKQEAQTLLQDGSLSPRESFTQYTALRSCLRNIDYQASYESDELSERCQEIADELAQEEERSKTSLRRKIMPPLEKMRLARKGKKLEAQYNQLAAKATNLEEIAASARETTDQLLPGQLESLSILIGEEVDPESVRRAGLDFVKEVVGNPEVINETREEYIKRIISPQINSLVEKKKIDQEQADQFFSAYRIVLNPEKTTEEQRKTSQQFIDEFFRNHQEVTSSSSVLLNGKEKEVLEHFVFHAVTDELEKFKKNLNEEFKTKGFYQLEDKIKEIFAKIRRHEIGDSGNHEFSHLHPDYFAQRLDIWAALRETTTVKAVFGEEVKQLDERIHKHFLERSLDDLDGNYIRGLRHYPTPQTIKNLIVLAATQAEQYRTLHANLTLKELAQRPDWQAILTQAEKDYPQLTKMHSILESWDWDSNLTNHLEIKEKADELIKSILFSPTLAKENWKMEGLAFKALSEESLLQVLAQEGLINEELAAVLSEALQIIKGAKDKWVKDASEEEKEDGPRLTDSSLRESIKRRCLEMSGIGKGSKSEKQISGFRFERLAILAQAIKENQDNLPVLLYLTNDEVIRFSQRNDATKEKVEILASAFKTVPSLVDSKLHNSETLTYFLTKYPEFLNENGLQFLNDFAEKYQDFPFEGVLGMVGQNRLSQQRALELYDKLRNPTFMKFFNTATIFPELILSTEEGTTFFENVIEKYHPEKGGPNSDLANILLHVQKKVLTRERVLELPDKFPELLEEKNLRLALEHPFLITTDEGIEFFKGVLEKYPFYRENLTWLMRAVDQGKTTQERVLELPDQFPDFFASAPFRIHFNAALEYPDLLFNTDEEVKFFQGLLEKYGDHNTLIDEAIRALGKNHLQGEIVLQFPDLAPALMGNDWLATSRFIFQNSNILIRDTSDLKFLNRLVGEYGKGAQILIEDYRECLYDKEITLDDKDLILEFTQKFRVLSPAIFKGYRVAKQTGNEEVFIAGLGSIAEKLTGAGQVTDEERTSPYFRDLIRHVYQNNAGAWTSYESNNQCQDRSTDLAEFKVRPRYVIDLLSASEIRIKEGQTLDAEAVDGLKEKILSLSRKAEGYSYERERMKEELNAVLDTRLKEITDKGGLQEIDLNAVKEIEEKLFLVLTDSIYGTQSVDVPTLQSLMINYQFAFFEDIRAYIEGTSDRVRRANNEDYALLCELHTFYTDRIKESNKELVEKAVQNSLVANALPPFFQKMSQETLGENRKAKIDRLRVDNLGISDSFVNQIRRNLTRMTNKEYTSEQVRKVLRAYATSTVILGKRAATTKKKLTRDVARSLQGQIESQRKKTAEAIETLTGEKIAPEEVNLGEINLQELLDSQRNILEGEYRPDEFAKYTAQRFINLFGDDREKIEEELAKFESISGQQRERLHAYITKTKESAHARMTGGVCVSGDNLAKGETNLWDMPNYLQMVFQDPFSSRCQGLVLMHHYEEAGQKILSVVLDPSSTYLYSVDETALFGGIMKSLEEFARDNDFDRVVITKNAIIRTNRTGGEFEAAITKKVAEINEDFSFAEPKTFSYHPQYMIQDMAVLWKKE